jgi:hypothetical protein
VTEISSRDQLELWLADHVGDVGASIALRSAMRAFPAIGDLTRVNTFDVLLVASFRAAATTWLHLGGPTDLIRETQAAAEMVSGYIEVASSSSYVSGHFPYAIDAAVSVCDATTAVSNRLLAGLSVATSTDCLGVWLIHSNKSGHDAAMRGVDAAWREVSRDVTLAERRGAEALNIAPLWSHFDAEAFDLEGPSNELFRMVERRWASLAGRLRKREQSWDVWIDWYNRLVEGAAPPWPYDVEHFRVTLDREEDWKLLPKEINSKIKAKIEEVEARRLPPLVPPVDQSGPPPQAPAMHAFERRGGKIFARPTVERPFDVTLAETIRTELADKLAQLAPSLSGNRADPLVAGVVDRLLQVLGVSAEAIAEGRLLMAATSLAAHARAYSDATSERERGIRALLDDVAASAAHLVDCYPGIRRIQANRLALGLQTVDAVKTDAHLRELADAVRDSPDVDESAVEALETGTADVDAINKKLERVVSPDVAAEYIEARAEIVGSRLRDAGNFVSQVVQTGSAELGGLSVDVWRKIRRHLPATTGRFVQNDLAAVATVVLVYALCGPAVAIAAVVARMEGHAQAVKSLKGWIDRKLDEAGEDDDAPET